VRFRLRPEAHVEVRSSGHLCEIVRSGNLAELQSVKALLEARDVRVYVHDLESASALGSMPGIPARLLVAREDIDRALQILRAAEGPAKNADRLPDGDGRKRQ
jgi:hypothetical protein